MYGYMFERFDQMSKIAKVQYSIMVVFGTTCIGVAFSPIGEELRIASVALLFGVTVGLWLSHLITVLYNAADKSPGGSND